MEILQRYKILFYTCAGFCALGCGFLPIYAGAPLLTLCLAGLARARFGVWGAQALALPVEFRSAVPLGLLCYVGAAAVSGSVLWALAAHFNYTLEVAPGWKILAFQILFQSLNEEILFRGWLFQDLKKSIWVVLGLAAVFAVSHGLTYGVLSGETLSWQVFASLFLFGVATSALVVKNGHVAFVWALHAGWNTGHFGLQVTFPETGKLLSEAAVFKLLEGSVTVVLLACIFACFTLRYTALNFMVSQNNKSSVV